ncbi:MAG: asparaginase domain-containing protein [Candidatus Saccharimonadales bacterium]
MDPTQKIGELDRPLPRIEVVYAGGTISSITTDAGHREGGHEQDLIVLLKEHSDTTATLGIEIGARAFVYTGLSENLTREDQLHIAEQVGISIAGEESDGVLVSHGTDSLEQTALLFHEMFGEYAREHDKKVIITASNENLDHPNTDAWGNLEFALRSFDSGEQGGVYVAFHDRLIPANEVVKIPYINGASTFVSKNSQEYQEAVATQQSVADKLIKDLREVVTDCKGQPQEVCVYGVNTIRSDHQELLDYVQAHDVQAVLLILYHSGTANTLTPSQSVAELVEKLRKEKGVVFFGVTETGEPTDLRKYETSVALREAGVVPLYDMLPAVAVEKLRLLSRDPQNNLIFGMLQNRVGEIDETCIVGDDVRALGKLYEQCE